MRSSALRSASTLSLDADVSSVLWPPFLSLGKLRDSSESRYYDIICVADIPTTEQPLSNIDPGHGAKSPKPHAWKQLHFLVTVPIAALTAVFLVLVFHYRLYHGDPPFPNLRLPSAEDERNVVYVDLSSSMILFTTSWASSVAPMLSSFVATVYTYVDPDQTSYTYLGVPETASLLTQGFTAKTYGARTQCQLISSKCTLQNAASSVKFNCSADFTGLINTPTLQAAFFEDESMSKNLRGKVVSNCSTGNPYYFALASVVNLSGGKTPNSTEFVKSLHGVPTYVLGCHTTTYDIEYDRLNNTVTRFQPAASNTSVSNIWQTSISQTQDWFPFFQQAAGTAIFSDTAEEFAEKVALALSKATIALGADALGAQPALAAQDRETLLVARIPVAPLVAMVAVCLLYVVCGLVLTGIAAWSARYEVRDVQARLSIAGLVADRFEEPGLRSDANCVEEMFAEHAGQESKRIAIESVDGVGVYRYTTWPKPEGSASGW
ncbi:hypothetical protein KXV81_000378 [Aspergillus fumigatus]|nr:hypothetical protein KXX38_009044 [Aspergillus fumigatus]KAH1375941.1 hypothetical protein KXX10_001352 [Aspergillus fumigatus]KAH1393781.1 hypothetical protein KXX49_000767 [Aspergillus fumigatus]KAH1443182.1 hypothetical protein KXX68_000307 [Aspergillus fumigatus]KAH1455521.1 hypothetical protein KXX58_001112 [Aspergillus fumigatus]